MSNFYYCNDCEKSVAITHKIIWDQSSSEREGKIRWFCKECGGTNWKAIIDSPNGEPKE